MTIFLNLTRLIVFFLSRNRYAEFSGSIEAVESEAESDSGVAPSLASSHSVEGDTRTETQPTTAGDDKRRSARRKE